MGSQQKANAATTTKTILVTLFFPLLPSADSLPPGAALQSLANNLTYKPHIKANGTA